MMTVLGLAGILAFCVAVIALAAAVTWLVVKLSPSKKAKPTPAEPTVES
jgi:flagellar biogenesis protein FliO